MLQLMLYKQLYINMLLQLSHILQDGPYERLYIAHETDASENGPSVTISVRGGQHSMTVQEISVMPISQFAFLWTVSNLACQLWSHQGA